MRKLLVLALLCPLLSMCQPLSLQGKIINDAAEPVTGATVTLLRTGFVTTANAAGEFSLTSLHAGDTLTVTAVGYEPATETFTPSMRGLITVRLRRRVGLLDEAIIIAYGRSSRRFNTGNVARVSAPDIARQPVSNPLSALDGRVAGLSVVQSSGLPGASVRLQLRGRSSLTQGSEPLFIIDGVPFAPANQNINQLTSALTVTAATGLSPFSTVNPADIESIEILKDADATAIYGSRGANGVVLITTKRGAGGQTRGSASVSYGSSRVTRTVNMLNTQEYLQLRREAFANDGLTPTMTTAPDLLLWDTTRYTDFKKLLLGGTAHSLNAQASVSGGSAATTFLLSMAYTRETTVFPGDLSDNKGSFSFAVSHASPSRRFTADLSGSYALDKNNLSANNLAGFINLPPNAPLLYTPEGRLNWEEKGAGFQNPLAYLLRGYTARTANWVGRLLLGYRLAEGLAIKASLGYNDIQVDETSLMPIASQNPSTSPRGASQFGTSDLRSWIAEPQLTYARAWGKWKLDALTGATWQQANNDGMTIAGSGYANDALLKSLSAAPTVSSRANSQSQYLYNAFFARLTTNYAGRYLLNLSGRRDGSSRFGPGNRFASFGAAGAAWIFSAEKGVMKTLSFLSFGKLRGSYGITGNDQIGDYKYLDTWSVALAYGGATALYPSALFNSSYGWEINRKLEGAVELGFWQNRLYVSAAWFRNRSANQLVEYVLPTQTGFYSLTDNFPALVQNTGWEVEVTATPLKGKAIDWTISANLTVPRNKLLSFPGLATSAYAATYAEGRSLSTINRLRYTGVDPATGVFTFDDYNKNGQIQIPSDYQPGPDLAPKWFGGLGNTVTYKAWSAQVFFVFKKAIGANWLSTVYQNVFVPGSANNQPAYVLRRWQKPGDITDVQKVSTVTSGAVYTATARLAASDGGYSDASFARLKTVYLSYDLPASVLKHLRLNGWRFYLQAQNLFTLTSYKGADPETQTLYAVPPLKTVMAGLSLTF